MAEYIAKGDNRFHNLVLPMLMNEYHILYYYQSIVIDRMVFRNEISVTNDHGYVPFIVFRTPTMHLQNKIRNTVNRFIKDEVLLTVGCPIFPPFYIDSQISVHRKFKKIVQLIFRNAKEIYFNEKFPIL